MSGSFADSNVLIYMVSADSRRADIAESVFGIGVTVSVQVLNECANVLLRKQKRPWSEVTDFLLAVRSRAPVVALDAKTHELGIQIAMRHRLAIYDSMIVATALLAGCETLYSEDMQHGLVVEGRLRIVNPFSPAAEP